MALKISIDIPEINDVTNKEELQAFITSVKQILQEVISKAQSSKDINLTTVPTVNDFDINSEGIPFDDGVAPKIYYLINGNVRYVTLT